MLEKYVLTILELNWNQRFRDNKTKLIICHHMLTSATQQQKGSLSNNNDDCNKNPANLHIWQWKTAFFIFWHFEDVLVLSMTWNDLFCSCVDDVIWSQMFNFVLLCPKRWFQFNSRIVRTHFLSIMTLNNWNAKLHFQMTLSLPSTSCLLN